MDGCPRERSHATCCLEGACAFRMGVTLACMRYGKGCQIMLPGNPRKPLEAGWASA